MYICTYVAIGPTYLSTVGLQLFHGAGVNSGIQVKLYILPLMWIFMLNFRSLVL